MFHTVISRFHDILVASQELIVMLNDLDMDIILCILYWLDIYRYVAPRMLLPDA